MADPVVRYLHERHLVVVHREVLAQEALERQQSPQQDLVAGTVVLVPAVEEAEDAGPQVAQAESPAAIHGQPLRQHHPAAERLVEQTVLPEHPLQPLAHELNLATGLEVVAGLRLVALEFEEAVVVVVVQVPKALLVAQEALVLWL